MATPSSLRRGSSSPGRPPQAQAQAQSQAHSSFSIAPSKRANSFTSPSPDVHSLPPIIRTTTNSLTANDAPVPVQPSLVQPSLLQPRVAVVLEVPPPWHPWLFALRLVSVLPAAWWGLPSLLQLLLRLLPGPEFEKVVRSGVVAGDATAQLYSLTETGLATIWCFASGYLSFFFTDCLMSRWLINYTPQATMVRLLTINACNAYLTAGVLSLAGGFRDPRLLLPGWIGIATTLTVMYHITHQKINIRKETSTSINVFSIASFISMVTLLAHMHAETPGYPTIPVVTWGLKTWEDASHVIAQFAHARAAAHGHTEL